MEILKLPVGIDNFEKIRRNNFYYIDKTKLVEQALHNWSEVTLFTRPRRFGKTLGMSMLRSFFEIGTDKSLFDGLYISQNKSLCDEHMGKYPVIFISLKDVEGLSYDEAFQVFSRIIGNEISKFSFLAESDKLTVLEKEQFKGLLHIEKGKFIFDKDTFTASLKLLSQLLYKHYGQKVVILIDEYDVPLDKAYQNGYYHEMVSLIRGLFGQALKTNDYLQFAILTGCLRISKESIFTGLNNFEVVSIMDSMYDECFGFTDKEVQEILKYFNLSEHYTDVREWYDGYHFVAGGPGIYNPFSLLNTFANRRFGSYWFETGTPTYLVELLKLHHYPIEELEHIVTSQPVLDSIDTASTDPIPVIYQSGYLTIKGYNKMFENYTLGFPNREVEQGFFKFLLPNYASVSVSKSPYQIQCFVEEVMAGKVDDFFERLKTMFADIPYELARDREVHYQNILYIIFKLMGFYVQVEYRTNRGRIDLVLQTQDYVYIMEFKLNGSADEALAQIREKGYAAPFAKDSRTVYKIGVNFSDELRNIQEVKVEMGQ